MLTCYDVEPEPTYFINDYAPDDAPPFVPDDEPTEAYLASIASEPPADADTAVTILPSCCEQMAASERVQDDTYIVSPVAALAAQNVRDLVFEYSRFNQAEIGAHIEAIGSGYRMLRRMLRQSRRGEVLQTRYGQLRLI